ncbi:MULTISPECIES: MaoC family dehydratase [unclassified Rhodococcus (in: high G+C Gram-positive bacteria)]|uniref:MaoC family dehydratase n=1 Tax=unclassified Rhodococcus (in: high G+C Gram-positive bacteria) TaxID=192944 RepID=UPI00092A5D21|nr:MaoC family dehydratase [Rhodococcus sp. M8]OLL19682.1 dehydratase [Rhodococcus sp. M8]QPG43519.1 MaoC family dehydratase [Rhodococcus sp. M8]
MSGLYFEELEPGLVLKHAVTRTVTETDNLLFTTLTLNVQPLHLDAEFAKNSMYGERIVNSVFTLGVVVGIPVQETTLGTTLGNLGFEEIAFPAPVLIGDTLRIETEILSRRESKSRPDTGIVRFEHRGFNQNDKLVCRVQRSGLMLKKPAEVAVS